ncbi:MAG TPA: sugar phosphate nucleotidyltransferase [Patescibacteria group bacterium]|nr:sugar phosphate nucleotidyltransferase [Patescibacteria group bacterium]
MKIVIMAGGNGTRLWPLSRSSQPKQLLKLIDNKTLLQNTYERFLKLSAKKDIYIATTQEYQSSVRLQLPGVPESNYSIETAAKFLGPAIGLAALAVEQQAPNQPVMFAWADHLFEPEGKLIALLKKAEKYVKKNPTTVFGIGVTPQFAHTGLGYMHKGNILDTSMGLYQLDSFKEKPDLATCETMIASNEYLWNAGIFVWNSAYLLSLFQKYVPEIYSVLEKIRPYIGTKKQMWAVKKYYRFMPKVDIEKTLLEKIEHGMVVAELSVKWADIGSFKAIKDVLSKPNDNLTHGLQVHVTSSGNLIYNFSKKQLVALAGVHNSVILVTDDVVLVAAKHESEKVKEIIHIVQNDRKLKKYL